ncbi:hypothetical protein TNCV_635981 [Trichonephila clavipes]|nr:hypothetical protein TNCV_635981 [Trichonephila clavipes]
MLDENPGTIRFQTGRECICVFRTNRTLMRPRPWADSGGLPMIRNEGRVVDPPLGLKAVFFRKKRYRLESRERKDLVRDLERAETSRDRIRSPKEIFSDERRGDERRWR